MSRFIHWNGKSEDIADNLDSLTKIVFGNREFRTLDKLEYGDHGLLKACSVISNAIREGKRIALYADYDVDGTMSAVSWLWFLRAIGHNNVIHYIPCRFTEGYGVNLNAVKHLVENEHAQVVITMDTGITANAEASWCKERGVEFICTDHHKIQTEKMPDCVILNPKQHPDPEYQELCGCGITFVLLRKLAKEFSVPPNIWTDLLALAGMATICDVVPLNSVNHLLAKLGVKALRASTRPILRQLLAAGFHAKGSGSSADEKDVGFKIGPRINAVGRLEHADAIIRAFDEENPDPLIEKMNECNERRKQIQTQIVREATTQANLVTSEDAPILMMGGDWHPGVVGIAASKIAENYWRPTWLYHRDLDLGICKGSARSILGFDVTDAMSSCGAKFTKFGGHRAAGGFSFALSEEGAIRDALSEYAHKIRLDHPELWQSAVWYDCEISADLCDLELVEALDELKPFGHGFSEPCFLIRGQVTRVQILLDKKTGEPRHTALFVALQNGEVQRIMFFGIVLEQSLSGQQVQVLVQAARNTYLGNTTLSLMGVDVRTSM